MGKRNRGQQATFRIGKNNQERPGISIEGEFDSCVDTFSNSSRRMSKAEKNQQVYHGHYNWSKRVDEYMNETRNLLDSWTKDYSDYKEKSKSENKDLRNMIKSLEDDKKKLNDLITRNNNKISKDLRNMIKNLEYDMNSLNGSITRNNKNINNNIDILEGKVKKNKSSIKNFNKPPTDELTGIDERLSTLEGHKNNSRIKALEDKRLDSRLTALENMTGKGGANDDLTGILERVSSLEEAVKLDHITPEHDADNNINFYINKNARLHQTQATYNSDFWARISALEMKPHNLTVENIPEMLRELTVRVAALEA